MSIIDFVVKKCNEHKITVTLSPDKKIPYPGSEEKCLGFFHIDDSDKAMLSCAMGLPLWEEVLLHEFNHGMQWIENCDAWSSAYLTTEEKQCFETHNWFETLDVIHGWLEHKVELSAEDLGSYIDRSILCELDCEKRTNEMGKLLIDNWDVENYIKRCNAYLRVYKFVQQRRFWPKGSVVHEPSIIAVMSPTFDIDHFSPLSSDELSVYDEFVNKSS